MQRGLLIHISSLYGDDAIGTLGREAYELIDSLKNAKQDLLQILPINPVHSDNNPFNSRSLFAGNPELIDLEDLVKKKDLSNESLDMYRNLVSSKKGYTRFDFLNEFKLNPHSSMLKEAFDGFSANATRKKQCDLFAKKNDHWLDDYCDFRLLKESGVVDKNFFVYEQFVFDEQMKSFKEYADEKGVSLLGDLPIYPGFESSDVFAHQGLFQLVDGKMSYCAGVPPDCFSDKGQKWNLPLYKWGGVGSSQDQEALFSFWHERISRLLEYHDALKIDHFRGFVAYGRIPTNNKTARNASWMRGPGSKLFAYLKDALGEMPFFVEDLGNITPAVKRVRDEFSLEGMRVLQFSNPNHKKDMHLPHNADEKSVAYTGTHDNDTLKGFLSKTPHRDAFLNYLNTSSEKSPEWQAIDLLYRSNASKVIIPMQDLLYLGTSARMNIPGTPTHNWTWRMSKKDVEKFKKECVPHLKKLVR